MRSIVWAYYTMPMIRVSRIIGWVINCDLVWLGNDVQITEMIKYMPRKCMHMIGNFETTNGHTCAFLVVAHTSFLHFPSKHRNNLQNRHFWTIQQNSHFSAIQYQILRFSDVLKVGVSGMRLVLRMSLNGSVIIYWDPMAFPNWCSIIANK